MFEFYVTPHCLERYLERVGGRGRDVIPEILQIIQEAIKNERRSKRKPRWIGYDDYRPKNKYPGKMRYVWDVHEQVCLLLHERSHKNTKCWNVVTCMTRRDGR